MSSDSIQLRRRRIRRSSSQRQRRGDPLCLSLCPTHIQCEKVSDNITTTTIYTHSEDETTIRKSRHQVDVVACVLSLSLSLAPKNNYLALLLIEWRWWIWWSGSGVEWTDASSQCQQSTYIRLYRYISFYYKIAIDIARKLEKVRCFSIGCD